MDAAPALLPAHEPSDLASLCLVVTEHAPQPMAMLVGASHIVCWANPAFSRLVDKPAEQLLGKPLSEMLPDQDQCVPLLGRVFRTGKPETQTQRKFGQTHPLFWSFSSWPVRVEDRILGVMIQVTETAKAHGQMVAMNEALVLGSVRQHELTENAEKSNARLQVEILARRDTERKLEEKARELAEKARLLDLTDDAIIVRGFDNKITLWNKGAEKLYGWSEGEVIGKHLHTLLQTEFPKPMAEIIAQLHREGLFSGEVVQVARDGRSITSLCRWALDANTQSILTSYTDITERKKMEDQLRHAHALLADRADQLEKAVAERTTELTATNKQLEAFVYSIAHDMRAPLRSMQGFSSLLVEETGAALSDAARDYALRIGASAQYMDDLLTDLLTFSAIAQRKVQLTAVNLENLIHQALARLEEEIAEKNARVEMSGPWPNVMAHEPTLGQVLINLVTNALKFASPGVPPLVRLRAEEQGEFLRVWVEDNGIGIAPEHHAQIFGLFTRLQGAKYPGTGIGLAIVEKGIERMAGRIGVESDPGQGSRFWFELWKAEKEG